MDLDARLEKLDARDEVKGAARAFVAVQKGTAAGGGVRVSAAPGGGAEPPISDSERVLADEFKAVVETMVLLAGIDGFVTDDELAQLRSSIEKMVAPETVSGLDEWLAQSLEKLTAEGWQERVKDVAGRLRSPSSRSLAFRLGAAVAFVDDDVAEAEAEAIEALAKAFGMSAEESQAILREVVEDLFGAT
jgi:hypothetical protein